MDQKQRTILTLSMLAGIFFLLSAAASFFPLFSLDTLEGVSINLYSPQVYFGLRQESSTSTSSYFVDFSICIGLLICLQVVLLASLSAFLSGKSRANMIFSLVLGFLGFVGFIFAKKWLLLSNPGLTSEGLRYGFGYYVVLVGVALGFILLLIALIMSKKPKKKNTKVY